MVRRCLVVSGRWLIQLLKRGIGWRRVGWLDAIHAIPLGFHQILEKLSKGSAPFIRNLNGEMLDFRMDREVQLGASRATEFILFHRVILSSFWIFD